MKRRFGGTVIAMVLCFILTVVSVYADDGKDQNPDYVTDYYMIVQSTQGGVDIYDEADTQSVKLNDSKIPNGTAIHVLGEKNGVDNKKWAYTQYHGMNGYVPMDDLDPASREEAANEEYRTFGGKDVDFEVKVHGNDGNVSVYNGPGEKFDQVSGTEGIADGTNWGKTDTDGVTQGWLNLDRDTDYVNENVSADAPEATGTSGNVPVAAVTPTPEATPTPKATPTPEVTPTEKVTPTPEATPTEEATPTPEETEKPASTEDKESDDKQSQKTSGKNVKADSGMKNPVIWISGIGIIVIIILLIYFLKKKK